MRILVVEDEEKVSRFVVKGLTAERFAVDVARDGKSGWELAQTYQYDLIILDLMLPGLTGGEVLNRIRKSKSQVPVLILTCHSPKLDRTRFALRETLHSQSCSRIRGSSQRSISMEWC
jgi:DNA-binding response OmpR family regulator